MKKILKFIYLLCILFITPIYAQTVYSLELNGISYKLSAPLISKNDTVYIALSQVADLAFTQVTIDQDAYILNFQNKTYEFKANLQTFRCESKTIPLGSPTFLINETLYVPIEVFKSIGYPYEMHPTTQVINLTSPTIYSRNSDSPSNHTYIPALYNLKNLPKHIASFSTPDTIQEGLTDALTNKHYISFLDHSNGDKIINYLKNRLAYSPYNTIWVSYRVINTHTYPNQVTDTVTFPLKIDLYGSTLRLHLNNQVWTYPTIWPAYYPSHSLTHIDLQKSIDSTLMHALYEYYRNAFDFKDDKYFEPFSIITSERTNQMVRNVYSLSYKNDESLTEYETPYTIQIQRVHPSGQIHYLIDIKAH